MCFTSRFHTSREVEVSISRRGPVLVWNSAHWSDVRCSSNALMNAGERVGHDWIRLHGETFLSDRLALHYMCTIDKDSWQSSISGVRTNLGAGLEKLFSRRTLPFKPAPTKLSKGGRRA